MHLPAPKAALIPPDTDESKCHLCFPASRFRAWQHSRTIGRIRGFSNAPTATSWNSSPLEGHLYRRRGLLAKLCLLLAWRRISYRSIITHWTPKRWCRGTGSLGRDRELCRRHQKANLLLRVIHERLAEAPSRPNLRDIQDKAAPSGSLATIESSPASEGKNGSKLRSVE